MAQRLLIAAIGLALVGCGDDKKSNGAPPPPAAAAAEETAPVAEGPREVGDYIVLGENKAWKPVRPLFENYKQREISAITDPTLSNVTDFVTRPQAPIKVDAEVAAAASPPGGGGAGSCQDLKSGTPEYDATPPLEREPLARYKLTTLMTGRSDPVAQVTDPLEMPHELRRGDRIGCEGGVVRSILQYEVIIQKPGEAKPIVWSIKPASSLVDQAATRQASQPKQDK